MIRYIGRYIDRDTYRNPDADIDIDIDTNIDIDVYKCSRDKGTWYISTSPIDARNTKQWISNNIWLIVDRVRRSVVALQDRLHCN